MDMKWRVEKWDGKQAGAFRTIFEGTEKKARRIYNASRDKIAKGLQAGGYMLIKVTPSCGIIESACSDTNRPYGGTHE